jgi:nucleotide-binding universal stress UspA family protein
MSISPKAITVFLDASPAGAQRAVHAASLAQRWRAHLIGVHVIYAGMPVTARPFIRGLGAFEEVVARELQLDADAVAATDRVHEHFRALCSGLEISAEFRPIGRSNSVEEAIRFGLHSDLMIVGNPYSHGLPDELSVEKLLLASGGPLLIVPNDWQGEMIGSRILIGWNATRQARRAVDDAMAFLISADCVTALSIDPREEPRNLENRDYSLAACVGRHGARVSLERVSSRGYSVPAILLGYAEQSGSDLLVVGAYSHARLKEFLLGGTTRTLLAKTPMPTLMSR